MFSIMNASINFEDILQQKKKDTPKFLFSYCSILHKKKFLSVILLFLPSVMEILKR
jgi:hypothetical protein